MEALDSTLTTGEQSGGQEQSKQVSLTGAPHPQSPLQHHQQQDTCSQQQHGQCPPKQPKRQCHERKRHRLQQRKNAKDQESPAEEKSSQAEGSSRESREKFPESSSTMSAPSCSMEEANEGTPKQKRERKPQKPGKYVCTYCGRACAKPSVLQKHIRSHTGERPYPCAPCGFSFKTKSNLYKHRKSHTHKVKAGLTSGREEPNIGCQEDPVTDTDDETGQLSSSSCVKKGITTNCTELSSTEQSQGIEHSHAVKKRLAMRLSRGRHAPMGSSDEAASSFGLGSKGSTESGYFSHSESIEISQESPPNSSAKSYAEIILGKYGRLGHLQRATRHQQENPAGQEGKSLAFTVPKKQVIDHITKLITINEAVVDTSKIDSVKPRRFSLSRRSSTETKVSAPKDPLLHCQKELDINSKSSGSITLGVPCEKFQQHSHSLNQQADAASTAPLLRSHSMPAAASETDPSATSSRNLRLSHSFDEPAQNRRHGMLRRQPAIELPIGAEITPEECSTSSLTYRHSIPTVPDHRQKQVEPYECEACGTGCNDWENYKIHKRHLCKEQSSQHPDILSEDPQKTYNTVRPGALAMRKRRKEESLELEDPAVPLASFPSAFDPSQEREKCSGTFEKPTGEFSRSWWEKDKEGGMKGISVIQHTSSFEKQDNPFAKRYEANDTHRDKFSSHDICHLNPQPQSQPQTPKPNYRKLVRQQHVQVPEILVTEDSNTNIVPMSPPPAASSSKDTEKVEEFQWPQRSPTLAQLPIEKLPPKKKRLRLAEAAQSSGESSFESLSLPRSPSQDSSVSHTSSRSASFEEPCKADIDTASMRKSRATHTLTIPTSPHHPHREMRRSASEQAPHIPQKPNPIVETRSKSFDYGSMSPARTPAGWRERRKCLLIRHSAVREPEEDEEPSTPPVHESAPVTKSSISPELSSPSGPTSTSVSLSNKGPLEDHTPQWQLDQSPDNAEVALTTKKCPHSILQLTPLVHSGQHVSFGSPQCPSGAARAHYSPVSTGLKLEILTGDNDEDSASANVPAQNLMNYLHHQHPNLNITPCSELLQPIRMQSIPVRLQSNLTINARSIYTTLSQITFTQLQEPSCSGGGLDLMSPIITLKNQDPTTEGSKLSSQGNKRVLSPSSSVELGSENQQQQKRVKEEGEKESIEHTQGVADVESFNEGRKVDIQSCLQSVVPMGNKEPSFPTLHTKLSCSWCFLNYVKPNPCTQSNYQNSVYSSWCTSLSNPNPLGLTSKEVLSLLQCKQRHSVFTYTMATIPPAMAEPLMPTNASKPSMCEVHPTRLADPTKAEENAELAKRDKSPNEDKEEGEGEAQLTPQYELSRVQVCEGGYRSSEEYVYVRGRGRGRYVCEECGIRCKKPSMLRKHIRLHTDTRPYACQHCNFAFKTKGNLTKHMKSKAHGKKCPGSVSGEADEEGGSVDYAAGAGEHQFSDAEDTEGDEEDEYDYDDEDEDSLSNIPHSSCSKYKCLPKEDPGVQVVSSTAIPDRGQDPSQPRAQSTRKPGNHKRVSSHSSQQTVISPPQITPTSSCCSSPIHSVSPGCNLSPAHPPSSGGELSPLRYPSPRSNLSVSSTQLSLSSSSRPTSPFLDLPLAPIWPASPCSPLPSAGVSNLQRGHRHRDQEKASPNGASSKVKAQKTCSLQGGLHLPQTHLCPPRSLLSRLPRVGHRVLSHLPLHSQQLAPTHSLMIPIGGIQMVQARPTLHHHPPMSPSLAQRSPTVEGRHISVVLDSLFKGWHSKQAVTEGQSLDDASGRPATKFNRKVDSCVSFATKGSTSSRDEKIPRDRVLVSSAGSLTHSKMSPTPIQTTKALSDSGEHPSRILCEAIPTTRSSKLNSQEEVHQETVPMANLAKLEK